MLLNPIPDGLVGIGRKGGRSGAPAALTLNVKLSVLDLVPVRTNQTTSDALAASVSLVQAADRLGYERYWVAEHHNMAAVAATSPPVLIAHLAAHTHRIRIGSGGVMLPNHAPLAVAEQFAMLEAAHPGRIDLGIGCAPGSDPVTSWALRSGSGRGQEDVLKFPQYLDDVMHMMSERGFTVPISGQNYTIKATPAARSVPQLWLLGSSAFSSHLAADKGLPYVFAHHFSGEGTAEALAAYRAEFRPSVWCEKPTTFLTVNIVVADTEQEAIELATPNLQNMARLVTGQKMGPIDLVEDALALDLGAGMDRLVQKGLGRMVIGTADQVREQLQALAEKFDVDEIMLHPVASARRDEDPRTSGARVRTLELAAEAVAG